MEFDLIDFMYVVFQSAAAQQYLKQRAGAYICSSRVKNVPASEVFS
jgi:hypothetical protein